MRTDPTKVPGSTGVRPDTKSLRDFGIRADTKPLDFGTRTDTKPLDDFGMRTDIKTPPEHKPEEILLEEPTDTDEFDLEEISDADELDVEVLPKTRKKSSVNMNFLAGRNFKIAMIIGSIAMLVVLFLISPVFLIEEVIVLGNNRVSEWDIIDDVGNTGNIMLFNNRRARRQIMSNLMIENVSFRRDFPGRLYVIVQERRLSAFVEHSPGSFLALDNMGRVLDIGVTIDEPLPILEGLQFTRWQLGQVLEVPNPMDFAAVVQYTQLLVAYDLIHRVSHIHVADSSNIRILVNYWEFQVGGSADADKKVRTIAAMLEASPDLEIMRGFVCIREIRPEYFFVLLQ